MGAVDDRNQADDLAKKTAKLNDQQRQQYQKNVDLAIEAYGRVTDQYRLDVVNALLQPIRASEQARQIKEADRREQQRIQFDDHRAKWPHPSPSEKLASAPTAPVQDGHKPQAKLNDPIAGVPPHGPSRDYGKVRQTHDEVATRQSAGQGAAVESATTLLSKEQLQGMAERYAEVRKKGKLEPTLSELRERNDLSKTQTEDRDRLERTHGLGPSAGQKQQRELLDHQHLAERVGSEARWIGQHLRKQGVPGAESFENDARRAHHTARLVHQQRQNLGAGMDRSEDAARVVQQQEQQKKSTEQEAARGGSTLTSEQRANASPDVKQTLDRQERAEAARGTGPEVKDHSGQPGPARPGSTRTGGRSR